MIYFGSGYDYCVAAAAAAAIAWIAWQSRLLIGKKGTTELYCRSIQAPCALPRDIRLGQLVASR